MNKERPRCRKSGNTVWQWIKSVCRGSLISVSLSLARARAPSFSFSVRVLPFQIVIIRGTLRERRLTKDRLYQNHPEDKNKDVKLHVVGIWRWRRKQIRSDDESRMNSHQHTYIYISMEIYRALEMNSQIRSNKTQWSLLRYDPVAGARHRQ